MRYQLPSPCRLACTGMLLFTTAAAAQAPRQTDADHYTRYELLAPGSAKFKITYEVTATTAGATRYFNPIRKGSVATDEAVYDRASGKPLRWSVVNGTVAAAGGVRGADSSQDYIAVELARAVPPDGGEQRLLIVKTYEDARSFVASGDTVVFTRPLGIRKNSVVLPAGYELVGVNYPSQVRTEADGRVQVSFMNIGPADVPYVVKGRKVAWGGPPAGEGSRAERDPRYPPVPAATTPLPAPAAPAPTTRPSAITDPRLTERARQDREIVYFLHPPETSAFDLYHDYTESRPGIGRYINVVRQGSKASNPAARVLDTGERLTTRTLRGAEITAAGLDIGEPVTARSEAVVIDFTPPRQGESVRLRISETYTDPARYRLEDGLLVWDRAFGRPANAMVLPAGWGLVHSAIPGVVGLDEDGRVRLTFENPRNDEVSVLVVGRRRR